MVDYLLNLTNHGVDIIRIDAVPYIWKELGTSCRNLPQVHNIVRMMRMICEIVCPGVLLLGEVVMEPSRVVPYFGTVEKPECHMLYNVTTMATTWHTVASKDVSLLKQQMDVVSRLPREYVFLNYLRCHDDIGWGLDYPRLRCQNMEETPHKRFLNDFFTGLYPGSFARGELYNDDPSSGDARLCGTTASLCGVEMALDNQDEEALAKAADSRYLHRGSFGWEAAEKRKETGTMQARLFHGIRRMEELRREYSVFYNQAAVWTADTYDSSVLCLIRAFENQKLIALFNFSGGAKTAWICEEGSYRDLLSGETLEGKNVPMEGFGIRWLLREEKGENDV